VRARTEAAFIVSPALKTMAEGVAI
ncbi:MAG TPA: succinyl-CoA--3-ketoacid-CoA transferase, partial [Enterobacteriaceae bacterium]|nr:succinyl-CoA--3-ketoacid-CoA transferase [Enterobacteriaceae bacterium]